PVVDAPTRVALLDDLPRVDAEEDRKSTRLNSSHVSISYAVFCLKKKNNGRHQCRRPRVARRQGTRDLGNDRPESRKALDHGQLLAWSEQHVSAEHQLDNAPRRKA